MAAEKKTTLLLKGENGMMRKKYTQLSKTIADQKDEIKVLKDKERELREQIRGLDKDILVRVALYSRLLCVMLVQRLQDTRHTKRVPRTLSHAHSSLCTPHARSGNLIHTPFSHSDTRTLTFQTVVASPSPCHSFRIC